MIPLQKKRLLFYIITFLLVFFSCQKKTPINLEEKDHKAQIDQLITIANRYNSNYNKDSAFYYFNKAKLLCNPKSNSKHYVTILNYMAEIQTNSGDYIGSQSTINEALPYLKNTKNILKIWDIYIIQGTNYLNTYEYNNALLYFNKAYTLKTNDARKFIAINNIAAVLMEQQKYNEALKIFQTLSTKKEVIKVPESYASTLDNIGFCYFKIKNNNSLNYLNEALKIRTEIKNDPGTAISNLHLAYYYDANNNPALSNNYALKAYQKFIQLHDADNLQSALKLLIKNSSDNSLKKYSVLYVQFIDSIFEIRQKAKNQFAKIKYDSKREKKENLKLKTQKAENELKLQRQKNRNIISYVIIVLSLCVALILYFLLNSRMNKKKIEATYNSETRISKKLHDELANDIYHTMAFAESKNLSAKENKEQLLDNLEDIYSRSRDISQENRIMRSNGDYNELLEEMIYGFNTPNINLHLNGLNTISWNKVDQNKKTIIYRVLQELLVNMKKHSEATLVTITFKIIDRGILINYTDNGKGIDNDKIILKNGLYNIQSHIHKIDGKMEIESYQNEGFKVFIKFPL